LWGVGFWGWGDCEDMDRMGQDRDGEGDGEGDREGRKRVMKGRWIGARCLVCFSGAGGLD
jgi:hypothetical protein